MKQFIWLTLIILISTANAGTLTKREFTKEGVIYIEETVIGENGNVSKSMYPKPGQEKPRATLAPPQLDPDLLKPLPAGRSKPNYLKTTPQAQALYRAISTCSLYQHSMPHPLVKDFTIEIRVHGLSKGKCKFTQTMPHQGLQNCLFSEQERKDIGAHGEATFQKLMMNKRVCTISGY